MKIEINGTEYDLATTLRVAYNLQGKHNHKPYSKIFAEIGDMPVETQIQMVFAAFEVANPDIAKSTINQKTFQDYCLDNFDLSIIMNYINGIIEGVMGKELMEKAEEQMDKDKGNL